ncbi:MAG: hypothetical protein PUP93_16200 [Rhizonema sp. NSF051]|nr:hypothetical protein [Rhizonema sp. NSF051]
MLYQITVVFEHIPNKVYTFAVVPNIGDEISFQHTGLKGDWKVFKVKHNAFSQGATGIGYPHTVATVWITACN